MHTLASGTWVQVYAQVPSSRVAAWLEDEMDLDWVAPEACTLPTVEQPLRVAEFDALFVGHLASVDASSDRRARMVFEGPIGLRETVQDLANRESGCCSFFAFTVSSAIGKQGQESVTLDVEVPQARSDVLASLVARARDRSTSRSA